MSHFSVYINPPKYLGQWLRHDFWDSESARVVFPRGSAPRAILRSLIRKPPRGYRPCAIDGWLPIEVPTFKGINPATFNYLSPNSQTALISACKDLFQATMVSELHELFNHDVSIINVVYEFMDRHGIEPDEKNHEAIRQMYYRLRKKNQKVCG